MKVVILGADGQLGSDLVRVFAAHHEVIGLTIRDVRVEEAERVHALLTEIRPELILNTAAYHRVPDCETHQELAWQVNSLGALHVAKTAETLGASLVYYSTDYVFDGSKRLPYVETDCPNPQSVYATTKLAGEYFTRNYCGRHYVIRISGIYGRVPSLVKGENFITALLRQVREGKPEIRVVDDEILTPTPTEEIAENTLLLIETGSYGLYHMTSEEECSWYEFASAVFEILQIQTPLIRAKGADFPSVVKRPSYSVLENANLKRLGINRMSHWRDGLIRFLEANPPMLDS